MKLTHALDLVRENFWVYVMVLSDIRLTLLVKDAHPKDMCLVEIGLYAQNTLSIFFLNKIDTFVRIQ